MKIIDGIKFFTAYFAAVLLQNTPKYNNVWVISERRDECKDNGYHLFKFIRENHPDVHVYYAIDKDSDQKNKILKYGNVINYNSWNHYFLAIVATRLMGAFLPCGIPDSVCFYKFEKLVKGKKIFLQHGITQSRVSSLFYENTKVDCYICGAKPEFEYIHENFHYPEGVVKYTGFSRFDNLFRFSCEKIILIMPTWRRWIPSATWGKNRKGNPDEYEFFHRYRELINDERFKLLASSGDMKIVFFLHHEAQQYLDFFVNTNNYVIYASEKEYDVQALIKKCSCLITDYSSVAFDVAYMEKPVIYYQFDEDRYYSEHYPKGYFDHETMGFGPKASTLDQVIESLRIISENNYQLQKEYKDRADSFFELHDNCNCKRIYDVIVGLGE